MKLARAGRRMRRGARAGSAALEFAFVAPVFFILLMGTIEVGIMFLAQFTLQNATDDAARMIRTGQVALNGITQAQFRQKICNAVAPLMQCDSHLQVDVETYANFTGANFTDPLEADGTLNPNLDNFNPGTVCSIVLVRTFYTWPVATPLLTPFMVNMSGDNHLISATAAFRNEPYTTGVAGC